MVVPIVAGVVFFVLLIAIILIRRSRTAKSEVSRNIDQPVDTGRQTSMTGGNK